MDTAGVEGCMQKITESRHSGLVVLLSSFFWIAATLAVAQTPPPHPDVQPTEANTDPAQPLVKVRGLGWSEPNVRYETVGACCAPAPPDVIPEGGTTRINNISCNWSQ